MKRREMVEKLSEYLGDAWHNAMYEVEHDEFCDDILDFVEKAGMLPPARPVIVEYPEPYAMVEGSPIVGAIKEVNTWEEEQ